MNLKKSLTMLIIQIILAIIVPLILFFIDIPLYIGFTASAVVIACLLSSYLKEKKSDKKAEKIEADFNNYFNSAEWHEKYLNYMQSYQFEEISPKGMKDDLKKRYRKMVFVFLIFCDLVIALFASYILFSDIGDTENKIFSFIFLSLIGAGIFYGGTAIVSRPVRDFYRVKNDFSTIENSYKNGKMMTYKKSGINIGKDYTVIYDEKNVFAIKNINIQYVTRALVRRKTYYNNEFAHDKYFNKLYIKTFIWEYMVELNEYQIETAINELNKV